ncbi:MAG: hypothetical protein KC549_01950 [Myxococcales bacterium]|nr:hypothetical protein [Myxococcales bacterium]
MQRGRRLALWVGCALLFGAAGLHPSLAPLAWLAVAGYTVALATAPSWWDALLGLTGSRLLACALAHPYLALLNRAQFDVAGLAAAGLYAGQIMVWSSCFILAIFLGFLVFRRRLPVAVWLPLAWGAAELLRFRYVVPVRLDEWLVSQWAVGPMLRLLGHLGWWPTTLLGLYAAALLGHAVLHQRWRWLLPAPAVVLVGWLLPSLAPRTEALSGVAALHLRSTLELPAAVPAGEDVDLLLWPEEALELHPLLGEGTTPGATVPGLLPTHHLLGLVTRRGDGRRQNQVLAVDPAGAVLASRAKVLLFPLSERPFLNFGGGSLVPGRRSPVLTAGGRAVGALICGELMSRELVAEAAAEGASAIAIVARDGMMPTPVARRQLLAIQVLRSVEFGLPSVRASLDGEAAFVAADGQVLARAGPGAPGMLLWDEARGPRDHPLVVGSPTTAVLYSRASPALRTRCPAGRCTWHPIEDFTCPGERRQTVILAGHGEAPAWLGKPPDVVADAVRCFQPDLVVVDTCYGASTLLLTALGDDALVVASAGLVPTTGLVYGPEFFEEGPAERRAAAVTGVGRLLRGRPVAEALAAAAAEVTAMDTRTLWRHLARRTPAQVGVDAPGLGPVLVPVEWSRLRPE